MTPRVLVIGLDSADADLIDRWCADGGLPTLAGLRRQGLGARLTTTAEVMHVSAWPTIYTGVTPGHHGMYHAYQIRAGEQNVHRTRADECARPPFWQFLEQARRPWLVMDAFMNSPRPTTHGVEILEYGTWTWFTEPAAHPPRVRRDILRRFGPYPAPEHMKVLTVPDPVWFRDRLVAGARVKADVVTWLLREQPWDMAFVTFGEPHGAGHYLWHVDDPDYPSHTPGGVRGAEAALREVYEAVDCAIGSILASVDDSVHVVVVSGDGMGPNYSGCHHLPTALHRLGLYYGNGVAPDADGAPRQSGGRGGPAAAIRRAIPLSVRQSITRCLPRGLQHSLSMKWVNAAVDWERSKVFPIPNANEGYLRVNLEGREPKGTVIPGPAYEDLLREIEAGLSGLAVPDGRSAISGIIRTDHVFPGPARQHLPDLVVTWDPEARVLGELTSASCGRVRGPAGYQVAPYYTGNHRPNAFVIARGPHIAAGATVEKGHILDLPATILAILGVVPPPHFQGRPWPEFLAP